MKQTAAFLIFVLVVLFFVVGEGYTLVTLAERQSIIMYVNELLQENEALKLELNRVRLKSGCI